MPFGSQPFQFSIEIHANSPAHADNHRLALKGFKPLLKMVNDVLGDLPDPVRSADNRLQLCPFGLQTLLALNFLAFRSLLKVRVNVRLFASVQDQLGQPALVVNRNGGFIFNGSLDVVDADVVPENGAGVGGPPVLWEFR